MEILKKSINDYFSAKFLSISFLIFLIPLVIFGILLNLGANEIIELFSQGANTGDFSFISENEYPILTTFLKFAIVKWVIVTLIYSLGAVFVVLFSLICAMITLGFLTPYVVKTIHKRHYFAKTTIEPMENLKLYKILAVNILKFLALLLITIPFAWIPLVINLPFFYLFHKLMVIDVASNMMKEHKFKELKNRIFGKILTLSICFFCLSLIPIAGIFLQLFFVIYFTHLFFVNMPQTQDVIILKNEKLLTHK